MNKNDYESRFYKFDIRSEKRAEGGARISGRAIVYSSPTDIGGWFREIIEPGALDGADLTDVPLLVNHNTDMIPVARSRRNTPNSTLRLAVTESGLDFEADLDTERNATARELFSAAERRDLDGCSFWFNVKEESWDDLDTDYPTRHILKFGVIREISAVTWPAYSSTVLNARSKEALESARLALESARSRKAPAPDGADKAELELLKLKINLL